MAYGLSFLLLGLQLLGLAHLTLQRHGVCWEHGTLTELRSPRVSASLTPSEASSPGLHGRTSTARLEDDRDDHCPVQASRRGWATPPAGAELLLAVEGPRDGVRAAGTWRADDGLLRRAPKQSPPLT